jgi:hypothetical protein
VVHDPALLDILDALPKQSFDGVPESDYTGVNLPRTQAIGTAVEFLGCDGLIAPSARWPCDHLMLFPDRMGADAQLELVRSETVDWLAWGVDNGLIDAR